MDMRLTDKSQRELHFQVYVLTEEQSLIAISFIFLGSISVADTTKRKKDIKMHQQNLVHRIQAVFTQISEQKKFKTADECPFFLGYNMRSQCVLRCFIMRGSMENL